MIITDALFAAVEAGDQATANALQQALAMNDMDTGMEIVRKVQGQTKWVDKPKISSPNNLEEKE
jgi:hypothetical protein